MIEHLAAQGRHIEAQVLQVRGDYDGAWVAVCRREGPLRGRCFANSKFLESVGLEVPELTTVRSGEPKRLAVKVRGQAKSVDVQVYVDLQLLHLKQRGFDRLGDVRLAGLPPF
ncbi:MAG: hypothetical protein IPH13_21455 [Planctomycetes bacterium]|nr:hypothetical protein [Planctomycetota bacterium]